MFGAPVLRQWHTHATAVRIGKNQKKTPKGAIFHTIRVYIIINDRKHMAKDNDILGGLLKGQAVCQRLLLQRYGSRVFAQIARVVHRQEDAEEVYQDVFVKAFRSIASYNPDKASLATWLMRIAYHESLNFVRGSDRHTISLDDHRPQAEGLSESEMDSLLDRTDNEAVDIMEQAIARLGTAEQSLISMFYYDELSTKEIAYITGSTPATVASRLFRTRQKLYHIIKKSKRL